MFKPLQSQKCIEKIKKYLDKDKILLEVGSGYSTIDFSTKVKSVYSIEHNIKWYNIIKTIIEKNNIDNINYILVEPNTNYINNKYPKFGIGGGGGKYWDYNMYKDYIEQIGKFNIKYDVCFVDGQARMHCYLYIFNHLNDDGILIIHDFYNNSNVEKIWNLKLLFKYYTEIDSIKKIGINKNRGNDVIILKKKNNVEYDNNDMIILDKKIPRC